MAYGDACCGAVFLAFLLYLIIPLLGAFFNLYLQAQKKEEGSVGEIATAAAATLLIGD